MCGRTVFTLSRRRVAKVSGVSDTKKVPDDVENYRSYNLGPTKSLVCVTQDESTQDRCIQLMKWGMDPRFETDKHLNTINARIEGLSTSKMYSPIIDSHRCVVIVDAFYEWTQTEKIHTPYLIRFKDDQKECPIPFSNAESKQEDTDIGSEEESDSVLPAGVSPLFLAAIYDRSKSSGENKCSIITMESFGCVSKE